jgi:hypothetical protein
VADAVAADAEELDLVVGPVVREGRRVLIYLSAAHRSGRTAVIETLGGEVFFLLLDDFHWPPEFEYDDLGVQRRVVRELVELAALHLFGHTTEKRSRSRWRRTDIPALEVTWQGTTHLLTKHGRTRQ